MLILLFQSLFTTTLPLSCLLFIIILLNHSIKYKLFVISIYFIILGSLVLFVFFYFIFIIFILNIFKIKSKNKTNYQYFKRKKILLKKQVYKDKRFLQNLYKIKLTKKQQKNNPNYKNLFKLQKRKNYYNLKALYYKNQIKWKIFIINYILFLIKKLNLKIFKYIVFLFIFIFFYIWLINFLFPNLLIFDSKWYYSIINILNGICSIWTENYYEFGGIYNKSLLMNNNVYFLNKYYFPITNQPVQHYYVFLLLLHIYLCMVYLFIQWFFKVVISLFYK